LVKRVPNQANKEVRFSGFIEYNSNGEVIFYECPPCPKCDGKTSGEEAGIFECIFCGWSPVKEFCSTHGYSYTLEGTWKLLRIFVRYKRLRWIVSEKLYEFHNWLRVWYLRGRQKITITAGDYMWSRKEKKWFKFM